MWCCLGLDNCRGFEWLPFGSLTDASSSMLSPTGTWLSRLSVPPLLWVARRRIAGLTLPSNINRRNLLFALHTWLVEKQVRTDSEWCGPRAEAVQCHPHTKLSSYAPNRWHDTLLWRIGVVFEAEEQALSYCILRLQFLGWMFQHMHAGGEPFQQQRPCLLCLGREYLQ